MGSLMAEAEAGRRDGIYGTAGAAGGLGRAGCRSGYGICPHLPGNRVPENAAALDLVGYAHTGPETGCHPYRCVAGGGWRLGSGGERIEEDGWDFGIGCSLRCAV